MSGFGRTSASVAICGVLGLLEALDSYRFNYIRVVWTPLLRHFLVATLAIKRIVVLKPTSLP
jgi:hypothetical protein